MSFIMKKHQSTNGYFPQGSTSNRWATQVTRSNNQQHNPKQATPNDRAQLSYPSSLASNSIESSALSDGYFRNNGVQDIKKSTEKCTNTVLISVGVLLLVVTGTAVAISIYLLVLTNKSTTTTSSTTTTWTVCAFDDTVIKFDTLTPSTAVPTGYRDISWTNTYVYTMATNMNGYYTGAVSRPNIVYNGGGNPMAMQTATGRFFNLLSAAAAAAWYNNLILTVVGSKSNVVVTSQNFTLQVFTVSYLTFNGFTGLDTVSFTLSGGTQNVVANGSGTFIALDNICLTFS